MALPTKNIMQVVSHTGHRGVIVIDRDAAGTVTLTVTEVDLENGGITIEKALCTDIDDEETASYTFVWDQALSNV